MRLIWTGPAVRDLASAQAYISLDKPSAADRQVELVLAAVSGLAQFPEMGRPGRRAGTYELVVPKTPFIVAYRVIADAVVVLRILHGRQRWPDRI
jgi:toxin ParE1/3/4